jgi:predicted ATPase
VLVLLDDVDAVQRVLDELLPIAERNKFPWPLTYARFVRGWLTVHLGNRRAGIEQMLQASDEPAAANRRPILLGIIAEQQLRDAQDQAAVDTLDRAMSEVQAHDFHFYEPELLRLRGDVLLHQSRDNAAAAEAAFKQAIALAREQTCQALELRSGVSLARLFGEQGRRAQARGLLAPIYSAFTEGFDRPDLQAAKALLAELA